MQGRTVRPGLLAPHGNVFGLGQQLTQLDLFGTTSLDQALKSIGDYARANPTHAWIRGRGWNQENWKLGRFPTSAELDAVVSDRPVWLERVDGHASVGNSAALAAAGVTGATRAPSGGKIENGQVVDADTELGDGHLPAPTSPMHDPGLVQAPAAHPSRHHDLRWYQRSTTPMVSISTTRPGTASVRCSSGAAIRSRAETPEGWATRPW